MKYPLIKLILFCTLLLTLMFNSQTAAPTQAQAFSCSNVAEISQAECNELVTLYNSTNGPGWTNKTGWLSTNTPCSWYGITCLGGQVFEINLYNNKLSGIITDFNLPNLVSLKLSNNQLNGTIPNFNLPNLSLLYLSHNQLNGTIPNFNLLNLVWLDLSFNQLSGTIPNFNQPNLIALDLSTNQLSGTIPDFNLPKLLSLQLAANQLTGTIPNFNLPKLGTLWLSINQLTGTIPNFNLPNLVQLGLADNQLSGTIPNFNLANLEVIYLFSNQLSGTIPSFNNSPNLTYLYLDNNQLSGTIPNFNLSKLQYLGLQYNQLSGTIPNLNWSSYTYLYLNNNCGLVAFDATQATVLANKDFYWQQLNHVCATLQVNPPSLSFTMTKGEANPVAQSLSISNVGTATLGISFTWTTNESLSWFSLSPISGTAPSMVNGLVDGTGLSSGNYSGTLTVTSSGGNQVITVTLQVNDAPTPTPTNTATATPSPTDTPTATPTDTPTATLTPTHTPTNTPTHTPTITPTTTPIVTITPTATATPTTTTTPTPQPTVSPTLMPSPTPSNPEVVSTIIPPRGGILTSTNNMASVQFPNGFITSTITLSITSLTQTTHLTSNFKLTPYLFEIIATNSEGQRVTHFNTPFTITFNYQDSAWLHIGQETDLSVYYWSVIESRWVNLLPCEGCRQDTVNNRFDIQLDHLTEFALLVIDTRQRIYLPVIRK